MMKFSKEAYYGVHHVDTKTCEPWVLAYDKHEVIINEQEVMKSSLILTRSERVISKPKLMSVKTGVRRNNLCIQKKQF